ncbi:MAG: winged helix-turn-helix domain-containing protein [Candidatus Woesearchaeota archaeon]|jgi:predicted transcriptional regulator|nr:winged helix-turn-helix domain-containing protein [Candidatus Woesearchaeota archaeon]
MNKKKFLLLSLEDNKAKKIANAITNKTSTQILDFLIEKEATESEIAKKLSLPISTIHYNLKQLMLAKLVEWEEAHYSAKGKKVKHYKLANQYIIIAPKEDRESMLEKLKTIIPTFIVSILGAGLIYIYPRLTMDSAGQLSAKVANDIIMESQMEKAAPMIAEVAQESFWTLINNSNAFWFLLGSIFTLIIYIVINRIRKK